MTKQKKNREREEKIHARINDGIFIAVFSLHLFAICFIIASTTIIIGSTPSLEMLMEILREDVIISANKRIKLVTLLVKCTREWEYCIGCCLANGSLLET